MGTLYDPKTTISICCILVTHQPKMRALKKVLTAVTSQVHKIVIVDNGSDVNIRKRIAADIKQAEFIENTENIGLGAAQNIGIIWAKREGFTHVLFLDQDSIPEVNMVPQMMTAFCRLIESETPLAAVGPTVFDTRIGQSFPFVRFGGLFLKRYRCENLNNSGIVETDFLISSGMLTSIAIIDTVGMMDEGLFIDNVDLEWSFRARHMGYGLYGVCSAKLMHCLGEDVIQIQVGRGVRIFRHTPVRQYYMTRNRILLYFRSYVPRQWIVHDLLRMVLKLAFVILFLPLKRMNGMMIINGLRDGFRQRDGKFITQTETSNR
jgi:rhamnosyltransferase